MLWLWYIALWTDLIGLVPGARPEARLLRVDNRRQPARRASRRQALRLGSSRATRPRLASTMKGRQRG
jgi:hypothetical protein